jgi:hypothetical protein
VRRKRVVVLAKALRLALTQIREELYDYGREQGIPQDQVDAAFHTVLTGMLGSRGWVH